MQSTRHCPGVGPALFVRGAGVVLVVAPIPGLLLLGCYAGADGSDAWSFLPLFACRREIDLPSIYSQRVPRASEAVVEFANAFALKSRTHHAVSYTHLRAHE